MKIGILKEPDFDNRVALLPSHISAFLKLGVEILVENNAGKKAFSTNQNYEHLGCSIQNRESILKNSDILLSINPILKNELDKTKESQILINVLNPLSNIELVKTLLEKKITNFSMDSIPRITRAQDKDILSSMATVSGYKAVLDAAMHLAQFFPMFMTAAGTIKPAKVLVLGAGVAGLQAIATAKRLGAQVEAFDVRSDVKEQVESLGAKFIMVEGATEDKSAGGYAVEQSENYKQKQQELIQLQATKANVIITTAQIPGKKAPILITKNTVNNMKPGSVIVDLAASSGGNCELTKNKQIVIENQVKIIGKSDYPSSMPIDASQMYGKNLLNFMKLIIDKNGQLNLDWKDEIVHQTCITHNGEIYNNRVKSLFSNQ